MAINIEKTLDYSYDSYSSEKVSGTKNLKRHEIKKLPTLEGPLFQKKYPDFYTLLQNCPLDISIVRKEENVNLPALRQLDAMTKHYEKKYGIKILLCHITEIKTLLGKLFQHQDLEPLGFILVNVDHAHVTPFLFQAKKGKQELLIMDSCGRDGISSLPCNHLMQIPVPQTCRRIISEEKRQADFVSCNTEAVTLLRNALIHINHLEDTFISLESLIKPMRVENDDLFCQLPAQWIYTDQITSSITSAEWDQPCIKQLVSKKNPSTIRQIYEKWQGFIISKITIEGIPENLDKTMESLTSKDATIQYENNTLTFKIEKSVNEYLAKKSQCSRFLT